MLNLKPNGNGTHLDEQTSDGATELHVTVAGMSEGALSVLDAVADNMTSVRATLSDRGKLLASAIDQHGNLCESTAETGKVLIDALQRLNGLFKAAMPPTPAPIEPEAPTLTH